MSEVHADALVSPMVTGAKATPPRGHPWMRSEPQYFWSWARRDVGGCWLWLGAPNNNGYGTLRIVREDGTRATIKPHRHAYALVFGPPASIKQLVCHRCDQRLCVRPSHLFLGTHADNNYDRHIKGRDRFAVGQDHGSARLTDQRVRFIRRTSLPAIVIAKRFGVHKATINSVRARKTWLHIT